MIFTTASSPLPFRFIGKGRRADLVPPARPGAAPREFGNRQNTGQVILGTILNDSLPNITDMPGYGDLRDDDSGRAALSPNLSKNRICSPTASSPNWAAIYSGKMLRHGSLVHRGLYLNLETMRVNPIEI